MKTYRFLLFLLPLLACHPEKNREVVLNDLDFKTSDGSYLYFKNVRMSDYEVSENIPAKGINQYAHKNSQNSELSIGIIHNWHTDQAYIRLALHDSLSLLTVFGESYVNVSQMNFKDQTYLAAQIFNSILKGREILKNKGTLEFDRQSFRIVFFDYLRLIDER